MRSRRLDRPAMAIVVVAASQVGHLLTTDLRNGPGSLSLAGTGVHAYAPALTTVALGAGGGAVLAALLAVAAARAAGKGARRTIAARRSLLDLTAALFAVQLAVYLAQEALEAVAGGAGLPSPGELVLWGCAGQLPVAVLAALLVRWLATSVEAAVAELAAGAGRPLAARTAVVPARRWTAVEAELRRPQPARAAAGRGPPLVPGPA